MMQASCYGRLGGDPKEITTRSGTAMSVGSLAVDISDNRDDGNGDDAPLWINIVCFGRLASDFLRHAKGDLVSVSGKVQRRDWTTKEGERRQDLQIVADAIVSARTTRPRGGGKKRQDGAGQSKPDPEPTGADPELNDEIPDFDYRV